MLEEGKGKVMAAVVDVAIRALDQIGSVSTMKLQKLVFYSQALSLVESSSPLFQERIEAWRNGPVVPDLFRLHSGKFVISPGFFDSAGGRSLDASEAAFVDRTIACLRDYTGNQLSELTHSEEPWRQARQGLNPTDSGHVEISHEAIKSFYGSSACKNPLFA